MILKSELTGRKLKKDLGLHSAAQRWHNKNKSGGNFGINLIFDPRLGGDNFELTGLYNRGGEVTRLSFGRLYQAGTHLSNCYELTYDKLITAISNGIDRIRQMDTLREVS